MARAVWRDALVELPEFETRTQVARRKRGVGAAGGAWERREPVSMVLDEVAARQGLRGSVAIPAIHGDEVLAVVELASREETEITDRMMRTLTAIGHELGQFLGRRRGELEAPLLSPRELEVLQVSAGGLSARAAGERLFVSPSTVRTHLDHIYRKLGVSDKASAVAKALRLGLIE